VAPGVWHRARRHRAPPGHPRDRAHRPALHPERPPAPGPAPRGRAAEGPVPHLPAVVDRAVGHDPGGQHPGWRSGAGAARGPGSRRPPRAGHGAGGVRRAVVRHRPADRAAAVTPAWATSTPATPPRPTWPVGCRPGFAGDPWTPTCGAAP
jgi:hypothetical protein